MRSLIILALSLTVLLSCQKNHKTNSVTNKNPEPKTISQQEVTRVSLVEADHFLTMAKNRGLDYSVALKTYAQAKSAYENGEYKKAQKFAVETRHLIEELSRKK